MSTPCWHEGEIISATLEQCAFIWQLLMVISFILNNRRFVYRYYHLGCLEVHW